MDNGTEKEKVLMDEAAKRRIMAAAGGNIEKGSFPAKAQSVVDQRENTKKANQASSSTAADMPASN